METQGSRRLKRIFGALLLAGTANLIGTDAWCAGPKVVLNIPAGEAVHTLMEFYLQSKVQVLYLTDNIQHVRTHAVSGKLEASEALRQMLKGTGLDFEFESELTAIIRPRVDLDLRHAGSTTPPAPAPSAVPHAQPQNPTRPGLNNLSGSGPINAREMVVTGSYIRGALDLTSPLQIVTKTEMKRTPYATVQDALRSLPLSSGAVQGEDFGGTGNFNRGSAISLHGLGAAATLVLVNGHRRANAGLDADFVDVSMIPWSAVERIEVLPDGVSALYGSDAIAGVVNIIMREDIRGAESQVRVTTTPQGGSETVLAQLFGNRWDSGNWLFAYQYSERKSLAARDRTYAANADKRSLGGRDFRSTQSNPGNILDPKTLTPGFAIPSGQDGKSLSVADLIPGVANWNNTFATYDLLPHKRIHSLYLSGSQQLNNHVEVFAEGSYGQRKNDSRGFSFGTTLAIPSTNPFFVNPSNDLPVVLVDYNFAKDFGPALSSGSTRILTGIAGIKRRLGPWRGIVSVARDAERMRFTSLNQVNFEALQAALADPNPATAFNPFGDGSHTNPETLESIRDSQKLGSEFAVSTASAIVDGPLFDTSQGAVKLATGLEVRREELFRAFIGRDAVDISQNYTRIIKAAFTELSVPLVGQAIDPRATPRLELSLAGRYEQHPDIGDTFNPKVGLRWTPVSSVKLRTTWGTSFKAPKFVDLYDTSQNAAGMGVIPDPQSPTGTSIVVAQQGNNPDLTEETATSWTVGFDLAPSTMPGLTLSLTYYSNDYRDQVIQPGGFPPFDILRHEERWAAVITRNPSRAEVDVLCDRPDFSGSVPQCKSILPAAIIDARKQNLAITKTGGLDLRGAYSRQTRYGHFSVELNGGYLFSFRQAFTATAPLTDILDTPQNPLALRLRSTLEWNQYGPLEKGFNFALTIDHGGGYQDPQSTAHPVIDALTTADVRVGYRSIPNGSRWGDIELGLSAVNVLNSNPPFVDRSYGYDIINAEPLGRAISLYIQKNW